MAVDSDPDRVAGVVADGRADEARVGDAGRLEFPDGSFDVVLYRLVMHHLAYQGPIGPCFTEAARLLRPGGALVAIEPGLWHPVGMGLSIANRVGAGTAIHGTPDDIPRHRGRWSRTLATPASCRNCTRSRTRGDGCRRACSARSSRSTASGRGRARRRLATLCYLSRAPVMVRNP